MRGAILNIRIPIIRSLNPEGECEYARIGGKGNQTTLQLSETELPVLIAGSATQGYLRPYARSIRAPLQRAVRNLRYPKLDPGGVHLRVVRWIARVSIIHPDMILGQNQGTCSKLAGIDPQHRIWR